MRERLQKVCCFLWRHVHHLTSSWGTEVLVAMMTALELLTPPDVHSIHQEGGNEKMMIVSTDHKVTV